MKHSVFQASAPLLLLAAGLAVFAQPRSTGMADPDALAHHFNRWKSTDAGKRAPRTVEIGLQALGRVTADGPAAGGAMSANLVTGEVESSISGLPPTKDWDLWFVDNQGAGSAFPDGGDKYFRVGRYKRANGMHTLKSTVSTLDMKGFTIDRAIVIPSSGIPFRDYVLTGAPNLYQRMLRGETKTANMTDLIADGRAVFKSETFGGNGRTCNTCHAETNNFTIDAKYIAALPQDDPLFAADGNPDLAAFFENNTLLRRNGLIVANADGFGDLAKKFVMRAVPSLLALATTVQAPDPFFGVDFTQNGNNPDPEERLGWGNDAPTVREFAAGAVVQHFTRHVRRSTGIDYRLPTDEELDALAAYQLSLGRYEEWDFTALKLTGDLAKKGRELYMDTGAIGEPGHKNCNACHYNGGGSVAFAFNDAVPGFSPKLDGVPRGFNAANGTNTNEMPAALALGIPRDGGFGAVAQPTGGFGNSGEVAPGVVVPLEEFATTSVIESADTAPFFHHHAAETLEDSIAFYGSKVYNEGDISIGNGPVPIKLSDDPKDPEVQAIAAFLRVVNAIENIRSASSLARRAMPLSPAAARELASLALGEAGDAIRVLTEGATQNLQEDGIVQARRSLAAARSQLQAMQWKEALDSLRDARDSLVDPATLPPSYRK